METATVKEMFRALFRNDQALTMVVAIVMINTALYITSNLVIYFFKYDFSPEAWQSNYTLFNTFGGAFQILAMMILFPLFRKFMNTINLFYVSFSMAFAGYLILLVIAFSGSTGVYLLLVPAFLIMSAIGLPEPDHRRTGPVLPVIALAAPGIPDRHRPVDLKQCLPQHPPQFRKAGGAQHRKPGDLRQEQRVEAAVVSLAVGPHQTRPVHPQHHMEPLEGHVMDQHVVAPLEERGVHGKHRE